VVYPVAPYIEERDGGLYAAGGRVSLDSVVIRIQQACASSQIGSKRVRYLGDEDFDGDIVRGLELAGSDDHRWRPAAKVPYREGMGTTLNIPDS